MSDPITEAIDKLYGVIGYLHPDDDKHAARACSSAESIVKELAGRLTAERDELAKAVREFVAAWDWWQVDPVDRCQPDPLTCATRSHPAPPSPTGAAAMGERERAIQAALNYFSAEIYRREYQRAGCKWKGQDTYVANLTAQIMELEALAAALSAALSVPAQGPSLAEQSMEQIGSLYAVGNAVPAQESPTPAESRDIVEPCGWIVWNKHAEGSFFTPRDEAKARKAFMDYGSRIDAVYGPAAITSLRSQLEAVEKERDNLAGDLGDEIRNHLDTQDKKRAAERALAEARKALEQPEPEVVAAVQQALMRHPHFGQSTATAFGYANTALKAFAAAIRSRSALATSADTDAES